ncbi:MAG TPA: tetratricopeptide repeat protein [Thermoanaerobaculia bacterium]|nr:tetratricopeptide repeat protein [Thermoanaerobaculia bacterium]
MRRIALFLLLVAAAGCVRVTTAPRSRPAGPEAQVVAGVPLVTFGIERCGAGSLSAVFAAYGESVSIETLHALLPKAANGGVTSIDLILEARRRGYDARLVQGDAEAVRRALADGRPAILMLKVLEVPGVSRDAYHYIVADGYDPGNDLVRVQFGDGKARWTTFDRLDRAWRPTGRATVLVAPGQGAPATEANALRFAAALEDAGRPAEAADLYRRRLVEDDSSPLLWTNLGNAEAARGDRTAAEVAYRRAVALDPAWPDALNNLAWLLHLDGERLEEAEALAQRAVAAGGPDPYLALDTLGRVLAARGRCEEASTAFDRARAAAPQGTAAPIDLALGQALATCGRHEEARRALERAAEAASDDTTRRQAESALAALELVDGSAATTSAAPRPIR